MVANGKLYTALVAPWICRMCDACVVWLRQWEKQKPERRDEMLTADACIHHATEIVMKERRYPTCVSCSHQPTILFNCLRNYKTLTRLDSISAVAWSVWSNQPSSYLFVLLFIYIYYKFYISGAKGKSICCLSHCRTHTLASHRSFIIIIISFYCCCSAHWLVLFYFIIS